MSPYFSVVIPTFNQCELLKKAILSVEMQTFKDYEIITGYKNVKVEVPIDEKRNTLSLNDRIKLNSLILELKENRNLSHSEVCDELNKKGLRTPTNKKWDKPKLSSYYNYIKKQYKLGKE